MPQSYRLIATRDGWQTARTEVAERLIRDGKAENVEGKSALEVGRPDSFQPLDDTDRAAIRSGVYPPSPDEDPGPSDAGGYLDRRMTVERRSGGRRRKASS